MSFLINRKAPSRIECLHSLLKFIYSNYECNTFSLEDCMFSRDEDNVHNYCHLIESTDFGLKCPYKESPLSDAGCYITNGKFDDTTKKKEVSNTINALHGMGFLVRVNHDVKITSLGKRFAKSNLNEVETALLIKKAILSYAPVIGVLDEIDKINVNGIFSANEIEVGYPVSEEIVKEDGQDITISTGSTRDANTRSRSCYLSWLVTAGVIEPLGVRPDNNSIIPYLKYRSFLNAKSLSARRYKIKENIDDLFIETGETRHPLDYNNLTNQTGALRENGQSVVREVTLKYESRIQNRRYAILFLLNGAFSNKTYLSFNKLKSFMVSHKDFFVISEVNFDNTLHNELHIANVGGVPYKEKFISSDILLYPRIGLNLKELSLGAPKNLIELLKDF